VTLPNGVTAGETIHVQAPDGKINAIVVPPGFGPGYVLVVVCYDVPIHSISCWFDVLLEDETAKRTWQIFSCFRLPFIFLSLHPTIHRSSTFTVEFAREEEQPIKTQPMAVEATALPFLESGNYSNLPTMGTATPAQAAGPLPDDGFASGFGRR
jgi:hypothetical protein